MLRLVDPDERHAGLAELALAPAHAEAITPVSAAEMETTPLPHDHPKWAKDVVTVSQRARAILARLRPIAVAVITFWDHRLRSVAIGGRRVFVDPSGSYRVE